MNVEDIELKLPSRIELIDKAVSAAEDFGRQSGFSEDTMHGIDMAVREAVINAVRHGNREDETKSVEIAFKNSSEGFEITVRDFGAGFKVEDVPDPTHPENLMKESGRGILFMRAFMDRVEWFNHAEGGMIVKMLKKR